MTQLVTFETSCNSSVSGTSTTVLGWVKGLIREYRSRTLLRAMLNYEDKILDDIGVTRAEIHAALSLPYDRNAAKSLMQQSQHRRREERGY